MIWQSFGGRAEPWGTGRGCAGCVGDAGCEGIPGACLCVVLGVCVMLGAGVISDVGSCWGCVCVHSCCGGVLGVCLRVIPVAGGSVCVSVSVSVGDAVWGDSLCVCDSDYGGFLCVCLWVILVTGLFCVCICG